MDTIEIHGIVVAPTSERHPTAWCVRRLPSRRSPRQIVPLIGRIVYKVVRSAPCSVLVVTSRREAKGPNPDATRA